MNKTADYARVTSVLQADKSVMSEGCKMLVLQDFSRKIEEYFDLLGQPKMEIVFKKGVYEVNLSFRAERVKKFNVLK
ncbi:MAG: hypothetical protein IJ506_02255 [Clostridia bacterium]|nr:hypothetical protein [Clostridia bacterium]